MPPASFDFLVESILMQAQMQLGLFKLNEEDPDPQPSLPLAKHSIDTLAMLQEKTRGNLSIEEQRLIENGLTELRFRYVQIVEEQKSLAPGTASQADTKQEHREPLIISADGGKGTKTE